MSNFASQNENYEEIDSYRIMRSTADDQLCERI